MNAKHSSLWGEKSLETCVVTYDTSIESMIHAMQVVAVSTSTHFNYYTGLIETSKTHFYGRAAAGASFSEGILRTFTAPRAATSFY